METLKKYPELSIALVALLSNIDRKKLRDSQLLFLKDKLRRNSKKWGQLSKLKKK